MAFRRWYLSSLCFHASSSSLSATATIRSTNEACVSWCIGGREFSMSANSIWISSPGWRCAPFQRRYGYRLPYHNRPHPSFARIGSAQTTHSHFPQGERLPVSRIPLQSGYSQSILSYQLLVLKFLFQLLIASLHAFAVTLLLSGRRGNIKLDCFNSSNDLTKIRRNFISSKFSRAYLRPHRQLRVWQMADGNYSKSGGESQN